jgi:hypothetical protein
VIRFTDADRQDRADWLQCLQAAGALLTEDEKKRDDGVWLLATLADKIYEDEFLKRVKG